MPLSPQTIERLRTLQKRAEEIASALGIPTDEAWEKMKACDTLKVMETVERMERRQKEIADAEMRAKAAYSATFKGGLEGK